MHLLVSEQYIDSIMHGATIEKMVQHVSDLSSTCYMPNDLVLELPEDLNLSQQR